MLFFKSLPLCLLLLIVDAPSSSATLVPRAIHHAHGAAVKRTKAFARDLRLAFRAVLVDQPPSPNNRVVYCKPGKSNGSGIGNSSSGGSTGSGNGTSPASSKPSATKTGAGNKPSPTALAVSPWKLTESHAGNDFFNGWSFFTLPDPTHGIVQYVDEGTARANNLLEVNAQGNAIMRVETTQTVTGNRQSVRITTQSSFNGGLVIMDSVHMPTGCGTWPAFWSNGPNWPAGGEIDIVEGVHDYTNNQATIHTNAGCTLPNANANSLKISGSVIGGTDCAALTTGNQGCGIRASTSNTFGSGFNANGGGVYAMQWDDTGIAVYFFPTGSVPADITGDAPQPSSWGPPQAKWPASSCDPFKFFNSHSLIFDTTLCGDWAGGVWNSAGIPGQEQSCAQRTGFPTCEAFVRASGSSFNEAYWEVKSVKIFQFKG